MTAPQDPFAVTEQGPATETSPGQAGATWSYGQEPAHVGGVPRNGLGTAALVVGILAVVTSVTVFLGVLLGVVAIVLGAVGRGRAKRGEATNGGSAIAGLVLGVVGLVVSIALVAVGVSLINSDSGKKLQDCLEGAGNSQAAQESCQRQFQDDLSK